MATRKMHDFDGHDRFSCPGNCPIHVGLNDRSTLYVNETDRGRSREAAFESDPRRFE